MRADYTQPRIRAAASHVHLKVPPCLLLHQCPPHTSKNKDVSLNRRKYFTVNRRIKLSAIVESNEGGVPQKHPELLSHPAIPLPCYNPRTEPRLREHILATHSSVIPHHQKAKKTSCLPKHKENTHERLFGSFKMK